MRSLDLGGKTLALDGVTHVMQVINLSPESRNPQTVAETPEAALDLALMGRDAGVSLVDLGAQSSHYDNPTIAVEEELARLLPTLEALVDRGISVSVDTWKPEVAERAIDAGAVLVNDTGGLADPLMRSVVAGSGAAAVVMYVEGSNPHDVGEIVIAPDKAELTAAWMRGRLAELEKEGITNVILDPGIAINYRGDYLAYTAMQLEVIRNIRLLRDLEFPILVPIPRKREDHRVMAYIAMALEYEADLIRVHDPVEACDLARLFGRQAEDR